MDIAELSMMLEAMEPREVSGEEFMDSVNKVKTMKGIPQEQQLILYGLFKQFTAGPNNSPQPDEADLVNKYKWDAWNSFKEFPKNNAALAYTYIVSQLLAAVDASGDKPPGASVDCFGAIVSTLYREYDPSMHWAAHQVLFKCVVEDDVAGLKAYVESGEDVNGANEEGMTALHFAADRGYDEVAEFLLRSGARVDELDGSGQTALMYAVSCENKNTVELLLRHGADPYIRNRDGQCVKDFEDVSADILALL
mmetsp:Transcript_43389/g.86212  ORF Transcript_43389/g.86212 Transcript_43389/m.86212 type:complete len:252 (-) Transcript_43389:77-832(-)